MDKSERSEDNVKPQGDTAMGQHEPTGKRSLPVGGDPRQSCPRNHGGTRGRDREEGGPLTAAHGSD